MAPKLYYVLWSPPSRACLFTLKALKIPHDLEITDLTKGMHLTEEFLKMNPQHTVPVLEDDGFTIWDSHAINAYLVDKYGKESNLYPRDLIKRTIINQRLHFDSGTLFSSLRNITVPILRKGILGSIPDEKSGIVEDGYQMMEDILKLSGTKYVASDTVSIADFSVATSLTALMCLVPSLLNGKYPLTVDYLKRCKETFPDYEEINEEGLAYMKKFMTKMIPKLYYAIWSPPSRACLFTLKALKIPHELQITDITKGMHLTDEFLKMNPHHTVPVLEDDGFTIWDSHAINTYLADKYGKNDNLYPKDLNKRAIINQRLHLDSGTLFPSLREITVSILRKGLQPIRDEKSAIVEDGYRMTEDILKESGAKYIASNTISIADFSVVTSLTALMCLVPSLSNGKYPLTVDYLKRCKETFPDYEKINGQRLAYMNKCMAKFGLKLPVTDNKVFIKFLINNR